MMRQQIFNQKGSIMTEKRCSHCTEVKTILEFGKNRSRKDGYQDNCNKCRKIFDTAYSKTDKRKNALKRHSKTRAFKKTQRKYIVSKKGRAKQAEYRKTYKEKNKAREAVNAAVKQGRLFPCSNSECMVCYTEPAMEYHHYAGYGKPNHLNVKPVCIKCHKAIHKNPKFLSSRL